MENQVEGDFMSETNPASAAASRPNLSVVGGEDVAVRTMMRVKKRNGEFEPVDPNKIVRAIARCCGGLNHVDPMRVATRTISGLYDGATTMELDQLSIQTAAHLIAEEPEYSRLAARLLATYIEKEVMNQDIHNFSQSIDAGYKCGLIDGAVRKRIIPHNRKVNSAIESYSTDLFEYFGLRTLYDRYLLKHPETRQVIETPQYFFMRVATGLFEEVEEAIEFYRLTSSLEYMPSTPTLFNSGTRNPQLSSCFLLDSPQDSLESIYKKYTDIALLSKFAGGIGVAYTRIRSRGSLIRGTNGLSQGVIPWLKTLDSSVAAVNQGGKRKGACCVYLETWHADIEEFLELRDNTGDEARRTHNLNLAHWVPDLFMRRLEADGDWSLFDPKAMPQLTDLFGAEFDKAYEEAEQKGLAVKKVKARDLYAQMMKTLAQTGNGWMCFKDSSNLKCNQTALPGRAVHLSNLCTEIIEVTNAKETAVCNLGSLNLSRHVTASGFDFEKLRANTTLAVHQLDKVIDINFYPIDTAADSNRKWRPVGLGVMGLQDVFFQMRLPFDSPQALELSTRIQEEIYLSALEASCDLAEKHGAHPNFAETRAAQGVLQPDLWGVTPKNKARLEALRDKIKKHGLRNSLLLAIAPTATIASICGCYECIEPQISNLFKRETLSGEFLQVNRYLVNELKQLGLWNEATRNKIKAGEGSVQDIKELPEAVRQVFRTVWELPQKALIDLAAERGAYLDQSQSLNLFMESPAIGKLSSMYMYAWKRGLKTTYYLRSRPATRIAQSNSTATAAATATAVKVSDAEAVACSLENPESCESCQ
jgi:ribonucleoside-diphosphate reductase alpha chain